MEAKKQKQAPPKPMRWDDADWAWLADVAKSIGLTRSAFIRNAAITAAQATVMGFHPYSVQGPQATSQNTRINLFRPEGAQKLAPGGGQAPVRSRSDCEAKDGSDEEIDGQKPNGLTDGKV